MYPGYYLPQDRAKRIDGLLAPKNDWTSTDVQKMILDNTSSVTPSLVANWLTTIDEKTTNSHEKTALEILKNGMVLITKPMLHLLFTRSGFSVI